MSKFYTWILQICALIVIGTGVHAQTISRPFLVEPSDVLSLVNDVSASLLHDNSEGLTFLPPENLVKIEAKVEVVPRLEGGHHSEILARVGREGLEYILKIDPWMLQNPVFLVSEILKLQVATNKQSISSDSKTLYASEGSLTFAELWANAANGSKSSQLFLLKLEKYSFENAVFTEDFLKKMSFLLNTKSIADTEKTLRQHLQNEILLADSKISELQRDLVTRYQSDFAKWKTQTATFLQADESAKKWPAIIANNDRAEVKRILETLLPWDLFEPSERAHWQGWLNSIERPNRDNSVIIFRGIGDDREGPYSGSKMQRANNAFSLRKLVSSIESNLKKRNPALPYTLGLNSPTLSADLMAHSSNSEKSNFVSFTTDSEMALMFAEKGVVVVKIDRLRAVPNLNNVSEAEVLVPLVVFPDEIVKFVTAPELTLKTEAVRDGLRENQKVRFAQDGLRFIERHQEPNIALKCSQVFN